VRLTIEWLEARLSTAPAQDERALTRALALVWAAFDELEAIPAYRKIERSAPNAERAIDERMHAVSTAALLAG
jgi:hypothetical protein